MHTTLLVVSGLMAIWSYADLIKDLVKHKKAQPLATRLALCFAMMLGCASTAMGHGKPGDLVITTVYACLSLVVVILSVSKGMGRITSVDVVCLMISIIGATAFVLSGQSDVGIAFAIGADLVAYWPTIRESWYRPKTQPFTTYLIGLGAALSALAADCLHGGVEGGSAFTLYLVAIDSCLPAIIFYRKDMCQMQPEQARG